MDGYTYQDLFDTQDALDSGLLDSVNAGTITTTRDIPWYKRDGASSTNTTTNLLANKDNLGSILGKSDAISAYKKRKVEQQKMTQAGVGAQQSILGGGAF